MGIRMDLEWEMLDFRCLFPMHNPSPCHSECRYLASLSVSLAHKTAALCCRASTALGLIGVPGVSPPSRVGWRQGVGEGLELSSVL